MKNKILQILIYVFVIILGWAMYACTPQKRFNRLVKNHPHLVKIDTVYSTLTYTVPAESKDTSFEASKKVDGLYKLIFGLTGKMDSLERGELVNQITNYIINRPCLDSAVFVPFGKHGLVKLWQQGGIFFSEVRRAPEALNINFPQVIYTYTIQRQYSWQTALGGAAAMLLLIVAIVWYLKKRV